MRPTPLSVLDLSPVPPGGTGADAFRNSVALARAAEDAGYARYWVAEHHLTPGVASASTPVLAALIAGATRSIRVGSGAVQMPMTPPLQVAEQFGTVAAIHPGRVDLGLGRFDIHKILEDDQRPGEAAGEGPPPPPSRWVDGLLLPSPGRVPGVDLSGFAALGERMASAAASRRPTTAHRSQAPSAGPAARSRRRGGGRRRGIRSRRSSWEVRVMRGLLWGDGGARAATCGSRGTARVVGRRAGDDVRDAGRAEGRHRPEPTRRA